MRFSQLGLSLELDALRLRLEALEERIGVGLYSAGLKQREAEAPVVVAGIQSAWNRAGELDRFLGQHVRAVSR